MNSPGGVSPIIVAIDAMMIAAIDAMMIVTIVIALFVIAKTVGIERIRMH